MDDLKPALERYLIPYFGNRPIDTISDKDVRDYLRKTGKEIKSLMGHIGMHYNLR